MVDWKGLFNWSIQFNGNPTPNSLDGTKPSDFKKMSDDDRKWLEEALEHYCIDEVFFECIN